MLERPTTPLANMEVSVPSPLDRHWSKLPTRTSISWLQNLRQVEQKACSIQKPASTIWKPWWRTWSQGWTFCWERLLEAPHCFLLQKLARRKPKPMQLQFLVVVQVLVRFTRPRSSHRSECVASRYPGCSPAGSWKDHEREAEETRGSATTAQREDRWSAVRVRRGGCSSRLWRSRRTWRRYWVGRNNTGREGDLGVDQDSWTTCSKQEQERATGVPCWTESVLGQQLEAKGVHLVGRGTQQPFVPWRSAWKTIPSTSTRWSSQTFQSDFESRPIQPGEPLSAGTTVRGWLAAKELGTELPKPCPLGVAGCWDLGRSYRGSKRRGEGEMRPLWLELPIWPA